MTTDKLKKQYVETGRTDFKCPYMEGDNPCVNQRVLLRYNNLEGTLVTDEKELKEKEWSHKLDNCYKEDNYLMCALRTGRISPELFEFQYMERIEKKRLGQL